jgi:proline iminopeptidase
MVVRGIFLGRPHELRWFNEIDGGASQIFPERWERFRDFIPPGERGSMLEAYWSRLTSNDESLRLAAARSWSAYEGGSTTLLHDPDEGGDFEDPHKAVSVALMEAHYFRHALFLETDQLLRDVARIRHIPATIVHGRYDIICPVTNAWELGKAWPEAMLRIVLAGHSAADPAIVDQLVQATDRLADRYA